MSARWVPSLSDGPIAEVQCSAYAWDTTGHGVVALIAEPRLTSDAVASGSQGPLQSKKDDLTDGTVVD